MTLLELPFVNYGRRGILHVECRENTSLESSGMEIVRNLLPDERMCLGYPVIHAHARDFDGIGIFRYWGFIQIISQDMFLTGNYAVPDEVEVFVDTNLPGEIVPFCNYGYSAEMYDAPMNTLLDCDKLIWRADTFLVTLPTILNNDTISFLAGYSWGYNELFVDNGFQIEIVNPVEANVSMFRKHLPLLRSKFPGFTFAD